MMLCLKGAAVRRRCGCQTQAMDEVNRTDPLNIRTIPYCPKADGLRERIGCDKEPDAHYLPSGGVIYPKKDGGKTMAVSRRGFARDEIERREPGRDEGFPDRALQGCLANPDFAPEDLAELVDVLKDAGYTVESPSLDSMQGMRQAARGTSVAAMDAARRRSDDDAAFLKKYPDAARVKVLG